jgi:ankyrin repeat protein
LQAFLSYPTCRLEINSSREINSTNKAKQTALHVACLQPSTDPAIIKMLLDAKIDVNFQGTDIVSYVLTLCRMCVLPPQSWHWCADCEGATALINCCASRSDFLEDLIESGADLNITDLQGMTALMHATNRVSLLDILLPVRFS